MSGVASSSNGGNLQGGGGTLNNRTNDISLNYRNRFNEKWQVRASYKGSGNKASNTVWNQRQTFWQDSSLIQEKEAFAANEQQRHTVNNETQQHLLGTRADGWNASVTKKMFKTR